MNLYRSKDFNVVRAALDGVAPDHRADSQGRDLNAAGQLWRGYLEALPDDAAAAIGRVVPGVGLDTRADSDSFFAGDLTDRDRRVTYLPLRPDMLVQSIPTRSIAAYADSYTEVYAAESGVAVPYRTGSTQTSYVDAEGTEELRPTMMFRADVPEYFLDAQRNALAGGAAAEINSQSAKAGRAVRAHLKAHNSGLLDGVAGFGGYSLKTLPKCLRADSGSVVFGATGTGVIDTALAEFRSQAQSINEIGQGAIPQPDTMLCTQRFLNRLGGYVAFEAGGSAFSEGLVSGMLSSQGITRVAVCEELRGFATSSTAGQAIDGVVFFSSSNDDSLRQVVGLQPAPVKTFDAGLDRFTAYLSGFAGLSARIPGSVLVYSAKVTV